MKKKLSFLLALLFVSAIGWAVQYCDFPTGHLNNADFGDANGRILLTLVPTGNANEYQLSIKPNAANGNVKKLDYLYAIIGDGGTTTPYPIEAGTDETSVEDELSATFTYTGGANTMTIQWSYPDWGGRWQCSLENLDLSALEACSGGGGDPTPNPDPTPDPDPVSYCDFPTGHEGNPNFGDANGRILLSLEPTGNANEYKMTIKPNYANGATKKLDYLYVIAGGNSPYPAEAGADEGGTSYDELSVTFTNSNATTSFTIQWSNPDWGGRWQCALNDVPLTSLSACAGGGSDPEPTEIYDVNFALQSQGGVASAKSGNDAGLANNGNTGDRWWSSTDAPMTDEEKNDQWWQVDLGQRRIFNTIQIVWEGAWGKSFDIQISDDGDAWTTVKEIRNQNIPGPFPYEQTIDLETNKTARYVRFQGIERGTGYAYSFWEFRVLLPGVSVLTSIDLTAPAQIAQVGGAGVALTAQPKDQNGQNMEAEVSYEITPAAAGHMSGNTYIPDQVGSASIRAYNGEVYSSALTIAAYEGTNVALNKTDDEITVSGYDVENGLFPRFAVDDNEGSLWSARHGETGDERIYDAWINVDLGAYYDINLIAIHWEGACSRHYHVDFSADNSAWRTAYNAGWNAMATHWEYLIGTAEDATKVRYVRVWSTEAVSQYGVKIMALKVYGIPWVPSGDTEVPVMGDASLESNTYTEAILSVAATDNVEVVRFHVVDATNGIDANFMPSEGKITITGLTHGTDYNFTITAIDAAGLESENNAVVPVSIPFNTELNLALNQPVVAGYTPDNAGEVPAKANDGNLGTPWTTWNNRPMDEQWWSVDLGSLYQLSAVELFWADRSDHYLIQVAQTEPTDRSDDSQWFTALEVDETQTTGNAEENKNRYSLNVSARYVRFKAVTKNGSFLKLWEFRVFGSGRAEVDTEAPVMSSASLVSNTDVQAVIEVAATDNVGIARYHVVDAGNSFDGNFEAEEGRITVTGLTGGTSYALVITAVDLFGNESANSKSVAVTTTAHYTAPQAACAAPTWPANQVKAMYSPNYEADCGFDAWGSGTVYTQETYGKKYVLNNNGYFGMVGFSLNCLLMEKLHYDIWIENDATVRFVPIWGGAEQGITKNLVGQQWNSIDINLSEYTGITNWGNIYQMKIDQASNLTFWVANAYFYREAPYVDNEAPTNASASKVAEGFYSVQISAQAEDNSGAVSFKVMNGEEVLATGAAATGVATTITVNNLTPGTNYNFNVVAYDEANNEAEPVVVAAETKFMPAAAPAPNVGNKKVVAVFTDAMACAVSGIQSGGWGEATEVEWLQIAPNDKVFYAQNFNYAGWHSWGGGDINASEMDSLHVDIYSTGMTQVSVTPISHDPTREGNYAVSLTPNAWTSVDIPLSAYAANNIEWNKIFQFKFMGAEGGNELMIDNVYFWRYGAKASADNWATFAAPVAVKVPAGVTVYKAVYTKDGDDETLTLTEAGDVIPANVGVLLSTANASDTYAFTLATSDEESAATSNFTGNSLVGCAVRTDISSVAASKDIFCLRRSDLFETSGFFIYSGQYIPAGKAYLPIPKDGAAPSPSRRVRFVFDTTTSVENTADAVRATKFIEDGQLFIRRGDVVYTIQGTPVK